MKRQVVGIWLCGSCMKMVAGGTQTHSNLFCCHSNVRHQKTEGVETPVEARWFETLLFCHKWVSLCNNNEKKKVREGRKERKGKERKWKKGKKKEKNFTQSIWVVWVEQLRWRPCMFAIILTAILMCNFSRTTKQFSDSTWVSYNSAYFWHSLPWDSIWSHR